MAVAEAELAPSPVTDAAEPAPDGGPGDERSHDTMVAIRGALALGLSLVSGWAVALLVRLWLPRHLGPEAFGTYNLADGFAAACFVPLGLGVETYIQKEIPVRPAHASDFFGGVTAVRVVASVALFGAMAIAMRVAGKPVELQRAAFVFGLSQVLVATTGTLAALLHASRAVGGLAIVNVATKLAWAVGIVAAGLAGGGLVALASAFLAAEAIRAVALFRLARRHLALETRISLAPVRAVVVSSLPFYLHTIAVVLYAKADVTLLSVLANDLEVGWYSTASNFAGLALLIAPLVGWVLMPLLSRTAARSEAELMAVLRRSIETVMAIAIPVSLFMSLGADLWIRVAFGDAFAPAVPSLRVLGPMFIVTYLAMIGSTSNILLGRAWTVTGISVAGLALNLSLNVVVVPPAFRLLGPGGAGMGAASVLVATEVVVTVAFFALLGRGAFDRRSVTAMAKSFGACAVAVLVDRVLADAGLARVAAGFAAYACVVVATGAVRPTDVASIAQQALASRRNRALA